MSITHRLSNTHLYKIFHSMKGRCYNHNSPSYKNYGQRGISICEEWVNNFELFYKWAIEHGWGRGLEIDRINVNGNYEPTNCRFVPRIINARNTRNNIIVAYGGRSMCLSEVCQELNYNYSTIYARVVTNKWDLDLALSTPTKSPFRGLNESRRLKNTKQPTLCRQVRFNGFFVS